MRVAGRRVLSRQDQQQQEAELEEDPGFSQTGQDAGVCPAVLYVLSLF